MDYKEQKRQEFRELYKEWKDEYQVLEHFLLNIIDELRKEEL